MAGSPCFLTPRSRNGHGQKKHDLSCMTFSHVSAENLQALLSDMGTDLNHDEVVEMIKAIDTDDDGQVSCDGKFRLQGSN